MLDETPQRDRPLEWPAGDRVIGRHTTGIRTENRRIPGLKPAGFASEHRSIGRDPRPRVVPERTWV